MKVGLGELRDAVELVGAPGEVVDADEVLQLLRVDDGRRGVRERLLGGRRDGVDGGGQRRRREGDASESRHFFVYKGQR